MVFTSLNRPGTPVEDEERYPALRIVLLLWKALVVLQGAAVVFVVVRAWMAPDFPAPASLKLAITLLVLLVGALVCIMLWALAEFVEVVMDIEENTRRLADRS
jgi:hypothetical protein